MPSTVEEIDTTSTSGTVDEDENDDVLDEESGDEDEDVNISFASSCKPTTPVKGGSHERIIIVPLLTMHLYDVLLILMFLEDPCTLALPVSPDVHLSLTPSQHPLSSSETPTNAPVSHDSPTSGPPFSPIDPANCSQERQTQEEVIHLVPRPLATVKLCGDNIDWTVHPSHICYDQQTQSIHYFHSYAVTDKVDLFSLSDNPIDQPSH